ncbi:hypothetical protein GIB67_001580 [Kingdonia uniflora]|uniref:DCD domain-containing protein n=1 Tax=Kingdonia uniflora TaxID=39325 RepID=A0A7J7L0M7_9MAGN|nr:hypothetical protein GIB67_001580 [Kingdonia uniflora]
MEMNNNNNSHEQSFWQFSDQLRNQTSSFGNLSLNNDNIWSSNNNNNSYSNPSLNLRRSEERRNFDVRLGGERLNLSVNDSIWSTNTSNTNNGYSSFVPKRNEERVNFDFDFDFDFDVRVGGDRNQERNIYIKAEKTNFNGFNSGWKLENDFGVGRFQRKNLELKSGVFNKGVYSNINNNNNNNNVYKNVEVESEGKSGKKGNNNKGDKSKNSGEKKFKTLPPTESLPRDETIGGYIFVCNNDTMQENLQRELWGLPPRYRDSVRAIRPGLPLFLYNYSTHQLHGVFEAASFGGVNIDPTAWEDKKCAGESRFPAQVRAITRKICEPLEEDSFRPILHHYDGPKFRLELNIPEALALLDIFAENKS